MGISLGQIAFEAYSKAVGGKTWDGKPIPHWNDVSASVRNAWDVAARAVESEVRGRKVQAMAKYLYVHGFVVYLLNSLPDDGDYVHGSYAAMHRANVNLKGYREDGTVEGLYVKVK